MNDSKYDVNKNDVGDAGLGKEQGRGSYTWPLDIKTTAWTMARTAQSPPSPE